MRVQLSQQYLKDADGARAQDILRSCVHCGFCTAVCPTYAETGNELDGPRGRIYLAKLFLEGEADSGATAQRHLDRCLTCRACESACPSSVQYAELADYTRAVLEPRRPAAERLLRRVLGRGLAQTWLVRLGLTAARTVRPLLPGAWRARIPPARSAARIEGPAAEPAAGPRRVFVHAGCVQPALSPAIDAAASGILRHAGYSPAPLAGCCGALAHHLGDHHEAQRLARRNIRRWLPELQRHDARLVVNASGCLAMLRDYPRMLGNDASLKQEAAQLIERLADPADVIDAESLPTLEPNGRTVACHTPCTRKHIFGDDARPWRVLQALGYEVRPDSSASACCGSAGTYSLLQPALAEQIRERKLAGLEGGGASVIATANVGCLHHLESGTATPVRHWVELAADALARQPGKTPTAPGA